MRFSGLQRWAVATISVCYMVSFLAPADAVASSGFMLQGSASNAYVVHRGVECFVLGLIGLAAGNPVWLANPLFWIGIFYFATSRWRAAGWVGLLASLVALTHALIPFTNDRLLVGYYLWLASMVLLAAFAFLISFLRTMRVIGENPRG